MGVRGGECMTSGRGDNAHFVVYLRLRSVATNAVGNLDVQIAIVPHVRCARETTLNFVSL